MQMRVEWVSMSENIVRVTVGHEWLGWARASLKSQGSRL